ncbi:MAG: hypothetical protein ABIV51_12500 [Saprospiraceae bacterium]
MRITKEEAEILYRSLSEHKYALNDMVSEYAEEKYGRYSIESFNSLENRLFDFADDKRRHGRTSQNSLTDCLKRFVDNFHYLKYVKPKEWKRQ